MCDTDAAGALAVDTALPAPSICRVIGSFPMGDRTCELLAFCKPGEYLLLDAGEMLLRGRAVAASMDGEARQYFWDNRGDIPPDHQGRCFVFPETADPPDIRVRYVSWDAWHWAPGVGWRFNVHGEGCVLVHLS